MPDFTAWPKTPKRRIVYHCGIDDEDLAHLTGLGWDPVDVRLLPNDEDHQRGEAVKAWLEGVRLGSIDPRGQIAKYVELEARIYGLTLNKQVDRDKDKVDARDVDQLLDFKK